MKLTGIRFCGFRGAKKEISFDVPDGFLVIVGRNGTGKSTICDAIEFALSGQIRASTPHTEKGEGLQDYVWWRGTPDGVDRYVEATFRSDEGVPLKIRRTPIDVVIEPTEDLSRVLCRGVHALEKPISQLCQTSILRDEEITRLSVDLKETDRFDFVRSALGTADFSIAEEKARAVQSTIKAFRDQAETAYLTATARMSDATSRLTRAKVAASGAENATNAEASLRRLLGDDTGALLALLDSGAKRLAEMRTRVDRMAQLLAKVDAGRQAYSVEAAKIQELAELKASIELTRDQIATIERELAPLTNQLASAEQQNPKNASLAMLREHGERVGLSDEKCPLCGSEQTAEHFSSQLLLLSQAINASQAHLSNLASRIAEVGQTLTRLRSEQSQKTSRQVALSAELEFGSSDRDRWLTEARALGFTVETYQDIQRQEIATRITSEQARILELESHIATLHSSRALEQVSSLERELEGLRADVENLSARLRKASSAESQIKDALDVIRRVRGEYINEQLSQLEPLMGELFQRLRPHLDWSDFRYRLRGDVRKMLSFEVGDGLNPSFVFSSGQRRAAGLAFLLALHLSRDWCLFRSLVLDDPVQHIDDYRALHLTEVLAAIAHTGRQVVCTVEDDALAQLLARRLQGSRSGAGMVLHMAYSSTEGVFVSSQQVVSPLSSNLLMSA